MCLLAAGAAYAQKSEGPQPPVVDPGGPGKAPSDAVVVPYRGGKNPGGRAHPTPRAGAVGGRAGPAAGGGRCFGGGGKRGGGPPAPPGEGGGGGGGAPPDFPPPVK